MGKVSAGTGRRRTPTGRPGRAPPRTLDARSGGRDHRVRVTGHGAPDQRNATGHRQDTAGIRDRHAPPRRQGGAPRAAPPPASRADVRRPGVHTTYCLIY
ncbi:hypothetical protein Saso_49290 [Streptomyces asoensis]|uniref:Uncharacterized protein n=1 Tax=Streptomyces asoensis TaxID=249586 RepID=A0ABQ3S576_9ACTN|nr:hypothetical protein GCM10010496_30400 [Streptomyces asoensis]GHI63279.1 hypothetical protein Saso_49290 [Streptomyces asoensis]